MDQTTIETVFLIAICRQFLFLTIFDLHSLLVLLFSIATYPVWFCSLLFCWVYIKSAEITHWLCFICPESLFVKSVDHIIHWEVLITDRVVIQANMGNSKQWDKKGLIGHRGFQLQTTIRHIEFKIWVLSCDDDAQSSVIRFCCSGQMLQIPLGPGLVERLIQNLIWLDSVMNILVI